MISCLEIHCEVCDAVGKPGRGVERQNLAPQGPTDTNTLQDHQEETSTEEGHPTTFKRLCDALCRDCNLWREHCSLLLDRVLSDCSEDEKDEAYENGMREEVTCWKKRNCSNGKCVCYIF